MYRRQDVATNRKESSPYMGYGGELGSSLNLKCFQEMFVDTNPLPLTSMSSPNTSSSSGTSPYAQFALATNVMSVPQQPPWFAGGTSINDALKLSTSLSNYNTNNISGDFQLQQQFAAEAAQRQLALATAARDCQDNKDEISNSLKMFAIMANRTNETLEVSYPQIPLDTITQDFAGNGITTDEFRYEQQRATYNLAAHNNNCSRENFNSYNRSFAWQQQQLDMNLNELRQNFLKMTAIPTMAQNRNGHQLTTSAKTAATAVATATGNIHCKNNSSQESYNSRIKKLPKRYNSTKIDKLASMRHCVFCDNNKEPEAVVKSHSVRDSHGKVLCPKLRIYKCPICHATGDNAHTIKYCPMKPIVTMEDAIRAEAIRLI